MGQVKIKKASEIEAERQEAELRQQKEEKRQQIKEQVQAAGAPEQSLPALVERIKNLEIILKIRDPEL